MNKIKTNNKKINIPKHTTNLFKKSDAEVKLADNLNKLDDSYSDFLQCIDPYNHEQKCYTDYPNDNDKLKECLENITYIDKCVEQYPGQVGLYINQLRNENSSCYNQLYQIYGEWCKTSVKYYKCTQNYEQLLDEYSSSVCLGFF